MNGILAKFNEPKFIDTYNGRGLGGEVLAIID